MSACMAIPKTNQNPEDIDEIEFIFADGDRFVARYGTDSAPLMNKVADKTDNWGKLTSSGRTNSASYLAFVERHRQARIDEEKKRRGS